MPNIKGLPRSRSIVLEDMVAEDSLARLIDAFVDSLDLKALGFRLFGSYAKGRPAYAAAVLLKIYLYGYLNRVRSSRRLEAECGRNIELLWLTGSLRPCYHTIATFRTYKKNKSAQSPGYNHREALRGVFRAWRALLDRAGLFGRETAAVDGTKIAAQNSKKNNLSEEKILKRWEYDDARFEEYLEELDRADAAAARGEEPPVSPDALNKVLDETIERVKKLEGLIGLLKKAQAEDPTVRQISLTDPDARALPMNNLGHVEIAYNVQSTVDSAHCLIADFAVENEPDIHLLAKTGMAAKAELGLSREDEWELLADKGYCYGRELQACAEGGITTFVAFPQQDYKTKEAGFQKADFKYDPEKDIYVCPAEKEMPTTGTVHEKHNKRGELQNQYKLYRAPYPICKRCPLAGKCLTAASHKYRQGRTLERSLWEEAVEANRLRVLNRREKYKRRQAIVEHPFGTIKRAWGYYYTLLKGKEKVAGEYALVFCAYNIRRGVSILGVNKLLEMIKAALGRFLAAGRAMAGRGAPWLHRAGGRPRETNLIFNTYNLQVA